jgi:hypothetical protein
MLFDKSLMYSEAQDISGGADSEEVDTGRSSGVGQPLKMYASGTGVTGTDPASINVQHSEYGSGIWATIATIYGPPAALNEGISALMALRHAPRTRLQYGSEFSAGIVTAGIVLDAQSNM